MEVLRTPDARFAGIGDFPFAPRYASVGGLRMHYVDAGPRLGPVVILLHGEPSWAYLYRHMIPVFAGAGCRVLAPDLIGFGRSDKPAAIADYSYQRHVDWTRAWLDDVGAEAITLFCQDWGALIGLRLVAEAPARFARVVVGNGFLPTGDVALPAAFKAWRAFARYSPVFDAGWLLQLGSKRWLSAATRRAYRAPFPDRRYLAAARAFPLLVPATPDDPGAAANRQAWQALERFEQPFHCAFADGDPVTRGADRVFRRRVPGAAVAEHITIRGAGHFLQEDQPKEIATFMLRQMGR